MERLTKVERARMEVPAAENRDGNMRRKREWRGRGQLKTGEDKVPAVDKPIDRARRGLGGWRAVKQSAGPDPVASQDKHM